MSTPRKLTVALYLLVVLMLGVGGLAAHAEVCDVDLDGDVDRQDHILIRAALGTRVGVGDPRDCDQSRQITIRDERCCVLRCSLPNCQSNFAPVSNNDTATTPVNTAVLIHVLANDTDATGTIDVGTVALVTPPANGTALPNGDGTVTYTPETHFSGDDSFTYTVDDNFGVSSNVATVMVTVQAGNSPPVLDPIGARSVSEGMLLTFQVTASDPNGDALILTTGNLPTGATFTDNGNGTGVFNWMPTFEQMDNHQVLFRVTDTGTPMATDFEEVTITVNDVNRPPVLAPIGAQMVAEGGTLMLTLSANDPDNDQVSFSAVGLPTDSLLIDNSDGTATFTWDPGFGDAGMYQVQCIATDDVIPSESDSETVTITVGDVNRPPVSTRLATRPWMRALCRWCR